MPVGLRSRVPAKITSSMRTPRRLLADCSPSTQEMESEILDLPHPFGPTTAAMPSPGNFSSVRSQKDLNPRICSFFSFSNVPTPSGMANCHPNLDGGRQARSASGITGWSKFTRVPANVPRAIPGVKLRPQYVVDKALDTQYIAPPL